MYRRVGRKVILAAACALLSAAAQVAPAAAQIRIVSKSTLDSLANPRLAEGAAVMRFARTELETGTIGEDDGPQSYVYRFRNEGSEPIAVTRVTTSCGCTEAQALPKTVEAGGEGEIRVTYYPKGHVGRFMRRIFVYTQLSDRQPTAVLTLNADVQAGDDRSGEYDFRMGSLLLKRNSVTFVRGRSAAESIEVCNAGDRELVIDCRRMMLPECLQFGCEPKRIAPHGKADITIRYDAAADTESRAAASVPLMLTGTGGGVTQSTIKVIIIE